MKAPVSWIREYVDLPPGLTTEELAARLTALGLKLEAIERPAEDLSGPLVVGRVLTMQAEHAKNGKTINWCTVDVGDANGTGEPQGIVCGAHNFTVGDLVVVVLPGGVLPGPAGSGAVEISARKTYGHVSAGMICSAQELGLGDDHSGIIVLPTGAGEPGDDAVELLHLRDEVIEFEINPDRAYALSLRGIAREAALAFDAPYRDPAERDEPEGGPATGPEPEPEGEPAEGYPVVVDDPVGCPVFVARTVSGFDPSAPTPGWLARRVQLAGMRPISLAVDVTNYVMLELGQPIHGYDAEKLQGPIRVRRAQEGERLTTLDDVTRTLSAEDLLITDDSGPIGLAGVMGGATTELSAGTTTIVIEAAHFDPVSVFRTQRRHKLPSEASKRFERGVDPTVPRAAADRVAELLVRFGGGVIEPGVTVVGAAPVREPISMPADLPARVTGVEIPEARVREVLTAVGCAVQVAASASSATPDVNPRVSLEVTPPPWRADVTDPFDLVEEVIRVVGYDQVPSVLPPAPAGRGLTTEQSLRRRIGRSLAGAGFVEVITFPFVGTADFDALGLGDDDPRRTALRLANPMRAEEPLMTTTLLPGILRTLARNVGRGIADVSLFETATVTLPEGSTAAPILPVDRRPSQGEYDDLDKALPRQPLHLALALSGDRDRSGWWGSGRAVTWADAVQGVRQVAEALGVEVQVRSAQVAPWHPGRCAEVLVGPATGAGQATVIGYAGELHPRVCRELGVPARTAVAEVDLDVLLEHAVAVARAPEFSTYPVAKEDVALVVDVDVPAATLAETLREGAGPLCESVRLFDVYTGEQIGEGRKSLAFALRFRAPDRTLTEAETAVARDSAVALAVERHGAEQRT